MESLTEDLAAILVTWYAGVLRIHFYKRLMQRNTAIRGKNRAFDIEDLLLVRKLAIRKT